VCLGDRLIDRSRTAKIIRIDYKPAGSHGLEPGHRLAMFSAPLTGQMAGRQTKIETGISSKTGVAATLRSHNQVTCRRKQIATTYQE